jgi:hypothetical protein
MINIFFSAAAAGTLRQVFETRGVDQRIIALSDSLDWGPIGGGFSEREDWMNRNAPLDFGGYDWLADNAARFREAVGSDDDRLVWIAPRSAEEQAGLYWFLDQFDGSDMPMIVADHALNESWGGKAPFSLGELSHDLMELLFDEGPRIARDPARLPASHWQSLVKENALLRIVDDGQLRSESEDFFDGCLLECCPTQWVKWHRVVGDTMRYLWDRGHRADSFFLVWRLRELIGSGAVDCDGDPPRVGGNPGEGARIRKND